MIASLLLLSAACSKPADEAGLPLTRSEDRALRAQDRAILERVVALDVHASQVMRAADGAAVKGDAGAAAELVEKRARASIDEALGAASAAKMRTAWGNEHRSELVGLLEERKAEIPRYVEAVHSGDPEKMLAAVEKQAAIERHALAAVASIKDER